MTKTLSRNRYKKFINLSNLSLLLGLGLICHLPLASYNKAPSGLPTPPPMVHTSSAGAITAESETPLETPSIFVMQKIRGFCGAHSENKNDAFLSDEEKIFKAINKDGDGDTVLQILNKHKNLDIPGHERSFWRALEGGQWDWSVIGEKLFWTRFVIRSLYYTASSASWVRGKILECFLKYFGANEYVILPFKLPTQVISWVLPFLLGDGIGQKVKACLEASLMLIENIPQKTAKYLNQVSKIQSITQSMMLRFPRTVEWGLTLWSWQVIKYATWFVFHMIAFGILHITQNPKPSIALAILNSKHFSERDRETLLQETVTIMTKQGISFNAKGTLIQTPEQGHHLLYTASAIETVNRHLDTEYKGGKMNIATYYAQSLLMLFVGQVLPYIYTKIGEKKIRVNVMHLAYKQQHNRTKEILAPHAKECLGKRGYITEYQPLPTFQGSSSKALEKELSKNILEFGNFLYPLILAPKEYTVTPEDLGNPFHK